MFYINKNINSNSLKDFNLKRKIPHITSEELPKPSVGERFLRGPIPFEWLTLASNLPGRALNVGIMLWHLGFLNKNRTVKLSMKNLREFGVKRNAVYRALKSLEKAKLITVERHVGRCAVVTINQLIIKSNNKL